MQTLLFLLSIYQVIASISGSLFSNYLQQYSPRGSSPNITINLNLNLPTTENPVKLLRSASIPTKPGLDQLMSECKSNRENKNSEVPRIGELDVCKYLDWYKQQFSSRMSKTDLDEEEETDFDPEDDKEGRTFLNNVKVQICVSSNDCKTILIKDKTIETVNNELSGLISHFWILEGHVPALFTDSVANMDNLERLEMDGVGLRVIGVHAFKNLPRLTYLSLQHNDILLIDADFFESLNRLEDLHLENNHIVAISPSSFSSLIRLTTLHLSHNDLEVFDYRWFKNNHDLRVLNFDHNKIKKLPSLAFKTLTLYLDVVLNFSFNEIESVGPNLFSVESINVVHILNLRHNNLTCVEGNLRSFFMALTVFLDQNPLTCDCLQSIVNFTIYNKHPGISFTEDKTCDLVMN